jgi:hypothetical protein
MRCGSIRSGEPAVIVRKLEYVASGVPEDIQDILAIEVVIGGNEKECCLTVLSLGGNGAIVVLGIDDLGY